VRLPFRKPRRTPVEIATDIPKIYDELYVDMYAAYLNRIKWAAFVGILAFAELIGSGLLFRDPFTQVPPPMFTYVNMVGFFSILITGGAWVWGYEHKKHNEVAGKFFARVNLRVRPNFKPYFHAPHRPIIKLTKDRWMEVHRRLGKPATPLSVPEIKALDAKAEPDATGKSGLNWYFFPWEDFALKGMVYGSPAQNADQLHKHEPGDVVWKGYPRKVGNVEDYDVGLVGEYRLRLPGFKDEEIIPIVIAAGDNYYYHHAYERIMKPVEIDATTVNTAQLLVDASIAQEVILELQTYKDQVKAMTENQATTFDMAGRMTETFLGLFDIFGRPEHPRVAGKLTRKQMAVVAIFGGSLALLGLAFYLLR
jgi:hypothetical protein